MLSFASDMMRPISPSRTPWAARNASSPLPSLEKILERAAETSLATCLSTLPSAASYSRRASSYLPRYVIESALLSRAVTSSGDASRALS